MKLKKCIFLLIIFVVIFLIGLNIKNFIILKKIYDNNSKIALENFYYEEKSYNNIYQNQALISCKNNIYLLNYYSKFNNETYNETIWTNENTKDCAILKKSNSTNNVWQQDNVTNEYNIENPKSVTAVCHITYEHNLIDLVIANLFNNVKINEGLYCVNANKGYKYSIDAQTFICKKIDSEKYDIHIEVIKFNQNAINDDITKISIEDL